MKMCFAYSGSLTVALMAGLVGGCTDRPQEVSSISETVTLTLTEFRPPKRAYATFKDKAGQVYPDIYVSKRCANWETKAKVGTEYKVERARITFTDGNVVYNHKNLYDLFC